jgi:hypothetical protein
MRGGSEASVSHGISNRAAKTPQQEATTKASKRGVSREKKRQA